MAVVNVKVAHIRPEYANLREWMAAPDHVYIGRSGVVFIDGVRFPPRASKWANPYKIGRDGTRDQVLVKYRNHIAQKVREQPEEYDLEELRDKQLGCWCHPDPCHGDILLELMAE